MLIDHYPVICLFYSYPQLIAHRSIHCICPLSLIGLYLLLGQHMTSRYYNIMCTIQPSKYPLFQMITIRIYICSSILLIINLLQLYTLYLSVCVHIYISRGFLCYAEIFIFNARVYFRDILVILLACISPIYFL